MNSASDPTEIAKRFIAVLRKSDGQLLRTDTALDVRAEIVVTGPAEGPGGKRSDWAYDYE